MKLLLAIGLAAVMLAQDKTQPAPQQKLDTLNKPETDELLKLHYKSQKLQTALEITNQQIAAAVKRACEARGAKDGCTIAQVDEQAEKIVLSYPDKKEVKK